LWIKDLTKKTKDTVFHFEDVRTEMELQGIDDAWIISNLKDIALNATKMDKDWNTHPDYSVRRKAIDDLSKMAKKTGSTEWITSTVKQLMIAQGAKSGDEVILNFKKMMYWY